MYHKATFTSLTFQWFPKTQIHNLLLLANQRLLNAVENDVDNNFPIPSKSLVAKTHNEVIAVAVIANAQVTANVCPRWALSV